MLFVRLGDIKQFLFSCTRYLTRFRSIQTHILDEACRDKVTNFHATLSSGHRPMFSTPDRASFVYFRFQNDAKYIGPNYVDKLVYAHWLFSPGSQ